MNWAAAFGKLEVIKWLSESRTEGCTTDAMGEPNRECQTDENDVLPIGQNCKHHYYRDRVGLRCSCQIKAPLSTCASVQCATAIAHEPDIEAIFAIMPIDDRRNQLCRISRRTIVYPVLGRTAHQWMLWPLTKNYLQHAEIVVSLALSSAFDYGLLA